ncbi:S-layer homology domain-containing protein [Lysinibacillus sp. NPDC096418]|uniref:S-layer homology domain-containing protein n=1 Tax=Lysinibacillus sp. NPDC096418 TaxID=3364138 RepID=UPI00381B970A
MANQPKKYKKFVATAATATLVASAIVPVASAAEFKDVAGNTHAEAINALADQGIINGYSDGTFKPNQTINRGQVVKLLGRWLEAQGQEIPADWKTEQRFNDLPVTAEAELVKYAALAKDAGVFNGSNGNLNYTQTMQRQQMAVVLVRAINEIAGVDLIAAYKDADFKSSISDLDKAYSAEQREAIVALEYAEITQVTSFNPANSVTRGQFASFLYRTMEMDIEVAVDASVKAINNTTVEVTFDEEVEDVKSLDFAIEGLEISNAAVKQTNKKVVVLTTSAQTADTEYTVTLDGEKIGSFKGLAAVIPTAIKVETQSYQAKVGTQVSIKANIGQAAAGVPVTFNVQATGNSLNENKKVEVTTDANGDAVYTYTQYGVAGIDNVTVYPTGAPSLLGYAKVYWGKEQILTVDSDNKVVDNGSNRTYKVKYLDPTTGLPVQNQKLNVTFKENLNDIDASKTNDTTASIRKDAGNYVTPYQDNASVTGTNREESFQIVTNSVGEATFVVTGKNTTATPVIYADANANNRFEATELQVTAGNVKFQGVQTPYQITFVDPTADRVAALSDEYGQHNPVEYKLKVVTDQKDKDGNPLPYIGATIKVAIQQNQDNTLTNNSPALISSTENGSYTSTGVVSVITDSKGEAKVYLKSNVDNSKATPVAWIDLNAAGQVGYVGNDRLEDGEPFGVAPSVTFLKSVVVGPKDGLNAPTKGAFVDGDEMKWSASLLNQSGKVSETAGIKNATFTIRNTSNAIQTINPRLVDGAGNNYTGLTVTYSGSTQTQAFTNGTAITLEPGTTVTIHGIASGFVPTYNTVTEYSSTNDAVLNIVAPNKDGKLSVSSSVTTVRKNTTQSDYRNNNNTYSYDAKEAEYLKSTDVTPLTTAATATVTGEVIGFEVEDNKFGGTNYGRVVIKERFTGDVKHYYYNNATSFSVALNADFTGTDNVASANNATLFENLLSIGDQIQVNNSTNTFNGVTPDVRLFNKDNSTSTTQAKGNGVISSNSYVGVGQHGQAASDALAAKYVSADVQKTNFSNAKFDLIVDTTTTTASTVTIDLVGTDTAEQIAAKINTKLQGVTNAATATVVGGRVVITAVKDGLTSIEIANSTVPTLFNDKKELPVSQTPEAFGRYVYSFLGAVDIKPGQTVTVNNLTYTAGTATTGNYTFNATGSLAQDLQALATVVTLTDSTIDAISDAALTTITLTEEAGKAGKASFGPIVIK